MELKFMLNKIVRNTFLIVALTSASSVSADSLIMCNGGRVKIGDKLETVKKKCTPVLNSSSGRQYISGKTIDYEIFKTKFKDGTKAAFIHIDDILFNAIVFD